MPPISEVKTVFTVDLAPFVDGLKTMLSMTETTGKQLNQLLTVNAQPPNFTGLEAQLQALTNRTKEYVGATKESVVVNQTAIPVEQNLTQETDKAEKALFKKADTLRGMRREATQSMGALMFLMMAMQQFGGSADDATKKTSSFEKGLKAAVPAGFGVAMMILMVAPELGVLAVALGVASTVGMTFLTMLNDTTAAMDRQQSALDKLSIAMRGMSIAELQSARENEKQALKAIQSELDKLDEKRSVLGILDTENAKRYVTYEQEFDLHTKAIDAINKELTSKVKSDAEARAFAVKAEIDAIADSRNRELADAKLTYDKEQIEWTGHHDALVASTDRYNAKIAEINKKYDDERKKKDDKQAKKDQQDADRLAAAKLAASDAWFERDLNNMRIAGIQKGLTQQEIDLQILTAQRIRYRSQLDALNQIIDINDAGQIKQQADLANKISAIDASLVANKAEHAKQVEAIQKELADYTAGVAEKSKQEQKDIADLAFEQFKLDYEKRLIVAGNTEREINNALMALDKARLQNEINDLNKRKTLTDEEVKQKTELVKKLGALELKETQDKDRESKARAAMVENAIQGGLQQEDAMVHTGAAIGNAARDAIKAYIAEGIASSVKSALQEVPFPLNLILAAAAGVATSALFDAAIPKFAQGTPPEGFIVPPGYDKDNFMIGVSSGEKVQVQSAFRNTYLPTINQQTMAAPAALRRQEIRDAAVESVKAQIEISQQAGNGAGGGVGSNHVHLHVNVNNLIGTDQYVRNDLKPAIEKLMRELGASSIDEVLINKWKNG